jgi:TetR/AcrR family transcriptional regulator, transcriptional repressor for nem operon
VRGPLAVRRPIRAANLRRIPRFTQSGPSLNHRLTNIPTGRYHGGVGKNIGEKPGNAKDGLVRAATELMLRDGYVATTVDEICSAAGVTKGAFFHHFPSKEALGEACLQRWPERMGDVLGTAPCMLIKDPAQRVLALIDYLSEMFRRPEVRKSCLAGTTVQEVSETNPVLREAAQQCFVKGQTYFQALLDEACHSRGITLDTASLANHWMCTMQGSLLLWKASRDDNVITENFRHLRSYLATLLGEQ